MVIGYKVKLQTNLMLVTFAFGLLSISFLLLFLSASNGNGIYDFIEIVFILLFSISSLVTMVCGIAWDDNRINEVESGSQPK